MSRRSRSGLGVRLLNRTTRRLALTEVGEVYRDHCARVVQEVEEADLAAQRAQPDAARPAQGQRAGDLRLPPPRPAAARVPGPPPGGRLDLALNDRVVDLLEEGSTSPCGSASLADSTLIARRLTTTGFVCAAAPAYLARAGTPGEPGDLAPTIACATATGRSPRAGASPGAASRSRCGSRGTSGSQQRRRAAGRSAGRPGHRLSCPTSSLRRRSRGGSLVRLLAGWERRELPIHAVFPPQRHPSAKLRAFVDFLAAHFGRGVDWAESCRAAAPTGGAG